MTHPHKTGGPWTSPHREEIVAAAGRAKREISELETRRKAMSRQITKLRQELAVILDDLTREEEALRIRREFFEARGVKLPTARRKRGRR
jgi:hypothetical protein